MTPSSDQSNPNPNPRGPTTEDECGYFDGTGRPEYRDELFGVCDCEEAPFWIAVEDSDGAPRTEVEARKIVDDYWGEHDEPWTVRRVSMYLGQNEYGDLRIDRRPEGTYAGPFDFWQFEEA